MGTLNPGGPLGTFREEQAMSRHRVPPSPFPSSSSHTTQLHYANSYTYSHPNLNFLQYTLQILVPHVMCSAQAVRELKIYHAQRHLSALRGTRSTQVHWVGIGTHTHTLTHNLPLRLRIFVTQKFMSSLEKIMSIYWNCELKNPFVKSQSKLS